MRSIESTPRAPHIAESTALTTPITRNRLGRIRNYGLATLASIPLILNGGIDVSAAPGQSDTTSPERGPKCTEVFLPYEDPSLRSLALDYNSESTAAAGANPRELGIRNDSGDEGVSSKDRAIAGLRRQLNAAYALQGEPLNGGIILDCSIWPGSGASEESSS